ncbi:MAG: GNAT family N-acetyltransferase [Actinomycetota bacterium]|nr:GNAT family N-acetyltransferase [Actinomycetota bacterium]
MTGAAGNEIRVVPVSEAPWDDVRTVFGTRGDPAGCFCQYFKVDAASWKVRDVAGFERSLCEQVDAARASGSAGPGVLAYLGAEPVGWVAVEPRPAYPRVFGGRAVSGSAQPAPEDSSVWAITCFVVRVGYRRRGVGTALLLGAVDAARRGGARVVEAYPVDTAGERVSSAELYHGSLSTFVAAGFTLSGRPLEGHAVVELAL